MLVNIAHSCRTQRVILTLPTPSPPPPPTQAPSLVNLNGAAAVADLQPSPSDMLSKVWWVELIRNCLKGTPAAAAAASVGDKPKKRADELFKKLSARQEASKLLLPEDKRSSWIFTEVFEPNLRRLAAIIVLWNHAKDDVTVCGPRASLLHNDPARFVLIGDEEGDLEGCYGYFDTESGRFVRFGKMCSSNTSNRRFRHRLLEHKTGALLQTEDALASLFYCSYPDESIGDGKYETGFRKGFCSQLNAYMTPWFRP